MAIVPFSGKGDLMYKRVGSTGKTVAQFLDNGHLSNITNDKGLSRIKNFKRFNFYDRTSALGGTKSFMIFTRPDMFIFENGSPRRDILRIPFFRHCIMNNSNNSLEVIRDLQIEGMGHRTVLYPLLSSYATAYTPIDDELESVEVGTTWHSNNVVYGRHNLKSRTAGTASITFKDNKWMHVFSALKAFNEYVEHVSLGVVSPRMSDIYDGIIDYPISMYYIVTDMTGSAILYWEKVMGMFPMSVPNSVFAKEENNPQGIGDLQYNIQFRYTARSRSNDPYILFELNQLTGNQNLPWNHPAISPDFINPPNIGNGTFVVPNDDNVAYPVVVRVTDPNHAYYNRFMLAWIDNARQANLMGGFDPDKALAAGGQSSYNRETGRR